MAGANLLDSLEELHKKTTPGEWYTESDNSRDREAVYQSMNTETEFGAAYKTIFDTANSGVMEVCEDANEAAVYFWDETGLCNFNFVAEVKNRFPDLARQFRDLLAACESMLATTGGSQHWQGETHESLKLMEAAVQKARCEY